MEIFGALLKSILGNFKSIMDSQIFYTIYNSSDETIIATYCIYMAS